MNEAGEQTSEERELCWGQKIASGLVISDCASVLRYKR